MKEIKNLNTEFGLVRYFEEEDEIVISPSDISKILNINAVKYLESKGYEIQKMDIDNWGHQPVINKENLELLENDFEHKIFSIINKEIYGNNIVKVEIGNASEIREFNFNMNKVRTVLINEEIWFVAKDVCEVLEIGNPSQALSRLDDDEKNTIILNEGIGNPEKSVINESGLYSLVLSSRKPEAKAFKKWITSEVLPSIRKHGGYIAERPDDTPEEIMARALLLANETMKKREERLLAKENHVQKNIEKIEFAEAISGSPTSILIGEFSRILRQNGIDIGQNRLFGWMREKGYLIKEEGNRSDKNLPTQKSMNLEVMEIRESPVELNGATIISRTPVITAKGQEYFIKRLKKTQETNSINVYNKLGV